MTSTSFPSEDSGPDAHPDVDELSALDEGLLPPERDTAVRDHLADCPLCAEVLDSLREIRDALGTLPGPARMPEDIAGRIDAALAAEALLDAEPPHGAAGRAAAESGGTAAAPRDDAAVSRGTTTPPSEPGDPGTPARVSRETGSARPRRTGPDRPAGHASGPARPGAPGRTQGTRRTRGTRRRRTLLLAAASVAVLGLGGATAAYLTWSAPRATDVSADPGTGPAKDGSAGSTSGTDSATGGSGDAALKRKVHDLLARQGSGSPGNRSIPGAPGGSPTGSPTGSPEIDTRQSPEHEDGTTLRDERTTGSGTGDTTLPSCVRKGLGRSETPLAVDSAAAYRKQPGYLVVLPNAGGDPARVDAYIVDSSCVDTDRSGPGTVLVKRTYPRG